MWVNKIKYALVYYKFSYNYNICNVVSYNETY